jgi:hypothetical protein
MLALLPLHLLTLVCDAGKGEGRQAFMRPAGSQEILHQTQNLLPTGKGHLYVNLQINIS